MISTSISCDTLSDPYDALRFFLDPIKNQFETPDCDIIQSVKQISILETRFKHKILYAVDVNWRKPFSTEFSLLKSVQTTGPKDLAKSITDSATRLYSCVSIAGFSDGTSTKDIARQSSDLSEDILACLSADPELVGYFMELAEVQEIGLNMVLD